MPNLSEKMIEEVAQQAYEFAHRGKTHMTWAELPYKWGKKAYLDFARQIDQFYSKALDDKDLEKAIQDILDTAITVDNNCNEITKKAQILALLPPKIEAAKRERDEEWKAEMMRQVDKRAKLREYYATKIEEAVKRVIDFIESYFVTTVEPDKVKLHHIDDPEWQTVKERCFKIGQALSEKGENEKLKIQTPNPILNQESEKIKRITLNVREIALQMESILKKGEQIFGLAAVQLGYLLSIIAVKKSQDTRDLRQEPIIIINPEIIKHSDKVIKGVETCLSVGHGKKEYRVRRYKTVKIKGLNLDGGAVQYKGRDQFGVVLQHEIDHTHGITIDQHGEPVDET